MNNDCGAVRHAAQQMHLARHDPVDRVGWIAHAENGLVLFVAQDLREMGEGFRVMHAAIRELL